MTIDVSPHSPAAWFESTYRAAVKLDWESVFNSTFGAFVLVTFVGVIAQVGMTSPGANGTDADVGWAFTQGLRAGALILVTGTVAMGVVAISRSMLKLRRTRTPAPEAPARTNPQSTKLPPKPPRYLP